MKTLFKIYVRYLIGSSSLPSYLSLANKGMVVKMTRLMLVLLYIRSMKTKNNKKLR